MKPTARLSTSVCSALAAVLLILVNLPPATARGYRATPASTITVGTSIQAAIDAASDGDMIFVSPGRYTERLTLNKPVGLTGNGPGSTVIQAVSGQHVLTVTGETITATTLISGSAIAGGDMSGAGAPGGGIYLAGAAAPSIQNIVVQGNRSAAGGIFADAGSPLAADEYQPSSPPPLWPVTVPQGDFVVSQTYVFTNTFGWLNYNGGSGSDADIVNWLTNGFTGVFAVYNGDLCDSTVYYVEALVMPVCAISDAGIVNTLGLRYALRSSIGRHIVLPLYDRILGVGANAKYHLVACGQFEFVGYNLSVFPEYLTFVFEQANPPSAQCITPVPPSGAALDGPMQGVVGQSYTFTVTVLPVTATTPVTYVWQASDQMPVTRTSALTDAIAWTWGAPGVKSITVTTANAFDSISADAVITIADVPVVALWLASASPVQVEAGTIFTASVSAGTNVAYVWDFGDGAGFSSGAQPTTTHAYLNPGVFSATVTAMNSAGSVTATTMVTVCDVPVAGLVATNDSPTALGGITHFSATVGEGTYVSYGWDFGDGSSAAGASVAHTYASAGTYTATVGAANSSGVVSTTSPVTVYPLTVSLTISKTGAGSGTVTSSPTGLSCGTVCVASFTVGTAITLTAAADSASTFAGWTGACTGAADCVILLNAGASVTATFDTHRLYLPLASR